MTHICVSKLTIIGSDSGLSPGRRQAIIWTNAGILLIRTLGTNFIEILGEIHSFSFSKMHLKMSSAKWRLFGIGLNELTWILVSSQPSGQSFVATFIMTISCLCFVLLLGRNLVPATIPLTCAFSEHTHINKSCLRYALVTQLSFAISGHN